MSRVPPPKIRWFPGNRTPFILSSAGAGLVGEPAPNLYVNPELAGGGPSGPAHGGANLPPTAHAIGFNTANAQPVEITPNVFEWHTNYDLQAGVRSYLAYDLTANNPGLEVGETYRASYEVENVGTEPGTVMTMSGVADITPTPVNINVAPGATETVAIDLEVIGAGYTGQIRVGTGVTTSSSGAYIIRNPKFEKIS